VKTRQIADRIARIQLEAGKVGSGLELTDPELSDAYKRFELSIGVSDTTAAENWLTTIEGRIAQIPGIIQTYNQKTAPAAPVRRIPAALLKAAGTFSPLVTLTEALAHVPARIPTVAALIPLLAGADKPEKVPVLIGLAHAANVALADVFHEFPADTKGDTAKAEAALTTIRDSGQNADFFLTGRGGQGWGDLRFAGEKQAPVWNDDQIARTDVHFGPLTKPTTTLAVIKAAAQSPAPGKKKLAPLQQEDPDNPRYMKKEYGNLGVKRCMILPYVTGTGHRIYYTEYDIRPYEGTKRGRERVVVGTDGRSYYTADHYKTFQEIR
jgi:hypothetical protein